MSIDALLDFIAWPESRNNPNAVWGKIKAQDRPPRPITSMTVAEVLAWQDSIDSRYMSEAAGAWQFLEDTLRGNYRLAGISASDLFSEATQRRLATYLLRRRGLDDYLEGKISTEQFAQNLSKEWASLPCIMQDRESRDAEGQSYYAGDGLNKADVSIEDFLQAVRAVRAEETPRPEVIAGPRDLERITAAEKPESTEKERDMGTPGTGQYITRLILLLLSGAGIGQFISDAIPGIAWVTMNGTEGFFVDPAQIMPLFVGGASGGLWFWMKSVADRMGGKT